MTHPAIPKNDRSLVHMLVNRTKAIPNKICVRQKRNGAWFTLTWQEYLGQITRVGLALEKIGFGSGDVAAILADTRVEWSVTDFAVLSCGGITTGLYTTYTPEQMNFVLKHSEAKFLVAENAEFLKRVTPVLEKNDFIKHVAVMDSAGCKEIWPDVLALDEIIGDALTDDVASDFRERAVARCDDPQKPVTIIYTSGTTGPPKGAVLSHKNFLTSSNAYLVTTDIDEHDSLLSVLPLAHALQRVLDYCTYYGGGTVCYAESIRTLVTDVKEVRPTIMAGVPRLVEKIFESVRDKAESAGPFKRKVFRWSLKVAQDYAEYYQDKKPLPLGLKLRHGLATKLVFGKVNQALGGNIRYVGSGGAALAADLAKFFIACDIPVLEAWGLTETTATGTLNRPNAFKFGTVGKIMPGAEIKIADDGEILIRGDCLFLGYFKQDEDLARQTYRDGWLLTGDIGEFDQDGFLKITDRKKELIITAYGKNLSPQNIENTVNRSPLISFSMAYGDNQKYLVGLVAPEKERLLSRLVESGSPLPDDTPLHEFKPAINLIEKEINEANDRLAGFEKIRRFAIVPDDFSVDTGELTPTLKLKRRNIVSKYKKTIRELYGKDWIE